MRRDIYLHEYTTTYEVAQLSQKDRAAGWVSYGQKWKTGTGRQYYRSTFNHCDLIGQQSNQILWKKNAE